MNHISANLPAESQQSVPQDYTVDLEGQEVAVDRVAQRHFSFGERIYSGLNKSTKVMWATNPLILLAAFRISMDNVCLNLPDYEVPLSIAAIAIGSVVDVAAFAYGAAYPSK